MDVLPVVVMAALWATYIVGVELLFRRIFRD